MTVKPRDVVSVWKALGRSKLLFIIDKSSVITTTPATPTAYLQPQSLVPNNSNNPKRRAGKIWAVTRTGLKRFCTRSQSLSSARSELTKNLQFGCSFHGSDNNPIKFPRGNSYRNKRKTPKQCLELKNTKNTRPGLTKWNNGPCKTWTAGAPDRKMEKQCSLKWDWRLKSSY